MAIIQKHTPGTFCWLDLETTDTGKAKHFYTILFGWEAQTSRWGTIRSTLCSIFRGRPQPPSTSSARR